MNLISFTAVGVRLLALMLFFYVLRESSRLISLASELESYEGWLITAIFIIGFLLIGLWLWISAIKIAKRIVPKDVSVENVPLNDFHRPIYQLAFILFGMYVLIYGISDYSYTAQLYFSLPDEYMTPDQVKKQQAAMFSSAIEVFFGLVLIIGATGVSKVIHKIRYGAQ